MEEEVKTIDQKKHIIRTRIRKNINLNSFKKKTHTECTIKKKKYLT